MMRNYTKSRAMAIAVLMAILAMGLYAPTSVPQQNPEEISIGTTLCLVPGAPVYLQALLQAYGITPRVISSEGSVRAYPDFRVETIALGQGRIVIEGLDEARTPVIVEIAVMVVNCPNLPAQPPPQNPPRNAKMVPLSPDPINLCVGETRSVYFEVQVFAGGLLHRDPARILAVNVDVPGIIAVAVANPGWVRVTGLAPGNAILDVSGQSQPLGTSPFTDVVSALVRVNVVLCPPPPVLSRPCPPGTVELPRIPPLQPRILAANDVERLQGPHFRGVNLPQPQPFNPRFWGYERFEVGVTPNQREPGGPAQWDFPPPGRFNLLRGWRTRLHPDGIRTNFYIWSRHAGSAPFLDPNPPVPGPDRRFATRWVEYRGYLQCAKPLVIVKFKDLNGNGIWDAGEPALPGWKIKVIGPMQRGQAAPLVAQGETDANGIFVTPPIAAPGTYHVSEELRTGWRPTTAPFTAVTVVEQEPGLIVPAAARRIKVGEKDLDVHVIFGNIPGVLIGFRIGPSGSCKAPTKGFAISVQITEIQATLTDCKTGQHIPEGTPAAFVLNPKEGVEEIKSPADIKDITVYAEGYQPTTVKTFQVLSVGIGPFAIRVIFLGTVCLEPL